jgi:polysaccharide deacetylase family protein (PEP-CTERM system associated)
VEPLCVLSFDVEEHHRIEAASGIRCPAARKRDYRDRMEKSTRRLLDLLAAAEVRATFFVVGDIARTVPRLVRDIHAGGHEIGSHSWNHSRVDRFTPAAFREDALKSKDALEQVTGAAIRGFRAPTFSIVRKTPWAIDVLAECGYEYDSSIFPVHHDRYGIPDAPRGPFVVSGREQELLELPPLTYRALGFNLPVAGGGYFRLFPLPIMRAGIRQAMRSEQPAVAMLYFHPWEFDEDQPRLPLGRLAQWRTYVGIGKTTNRLKSLLRDVTYTRAADAVEALRAPEANLPRVGIAAPSPAGTPVFGQAARL